MIRDSKMITTQLLAPNETINPKVVLIEINKIQPLEKWIKLSKIPPKINMPKNQSKLKSKLWPYNVMLNYPPKNR